MFFWVIVDSQTFSIKLSLASLVIFFRLLAKFNLNGVTSFSRFFSKIIRKAFPKFSEGLENLYEKHYQKPQSSFPKLHTAGFAILSENFSLAKECWQLPQDFLGNFPELIREVSLGAIPKALRKAFQSYSDELSEASQRFF